MTHPLLNRHLFDQYGRGLPPPPKTPADFEQQRLTHLLLNHRSSNMMGAAPPPTLPQVLSCSQRLTNPLLNHQFFEHHRRGGRSPPNPPAGFKLFTEINPPFVESSHLQSFSLSVCPSFFLSFSLSPFLPFSLSPFLPFSLSPFLPFSLSPLLPFSLSPFLPFSFSFPLSLSLSLFLSLFLSFLPFSACLFLLFFLYRLRKCCACRETCTVPCESAALAAKSVPYLAKKLRLPRNLYRTLRKSCACREICSVFLFVVSIASTEKKSVFDP